MDRSDFLDEHLTLVVGPMAAVYVKNGRTVARIDLIHVGNRLPWYWWQTATAAGEAQNLREAKTALRAALATGTDQQAEADDSLPSIAAV